LEHPDEGFSYYREEGASSVVCEEKHMGSRAVVFLCRDEEAARNRFGIVGEGIGVVTTRTGRRFFDDLGLESAFLERVRDAATEAKLWDELQTDWMILDCELMPWSAKAQALLREQYAAVGAAAHASTQVALDVAILAGARGVEGASELVGRLGQRRQAAEQFVDSYRRYCWRVSSLDDLRLAPFHILATEGSVHRDKTHLWHMETLARLCAADERLLFRTPYRVVHLNDGGSVAEGVEWWEDMTAKGGEGMVIKPLDFVLRGKRGLAQPAVKCRGREYLRIIYGPEYTLPENLDRLRSRGVGRKRSLALREFALGMEALDRFVRRDPLRRVHECVFGVLALESEPVDPRL
jgi:protein phosphatase